MRGFAVDETPLEEQEDEDVEILEDEERRQAMKGKRRVDPKEIKE